MWELSFYMPIHRSEFSQIPAEILSCWDTKPCICQTPDGRGFSRYFPRKGRVQGQSKFSHNMPHFHNPVRFGRSPESVTAAGTWQSPGAAPNSAVFREDWIKHHLWPLLLSTPLMYARISPTSCILEIWLLIFLCRCKFRVIPDEEMAASRVLDFTQWISCCWGLTLIRDGKDDGCEGTKCHR